MSVRQRKKTISEQV